MPLIAGVAGSPGFALLGEFLLALPQKKPKGLAPSSGPALRFGCPRSVIAPRGLGEGPSLAHRRLRRFLRLTPLRHDCTQPDERGAWALPESSCQIAQELVFTLELQARQTPLASRAKPGNPVTSAVSRLLERTRSALHPPACFRLQIAGIWPPGPLASYTLLCAQSRQFPVRELKQ